MWIVINIIGYDEYNAVIMCDENRHNIIFDTESEANKWARKNCPYTFKVVGL